MTHTTESAYKNDIISQLASAVWSVFPAKWGAPHSTVQGYSVFGDNWLATPMAVWDTLIEGRDSLNNAKPDPGLTRLQPFGRDPISTWAKFAARWRWKKTECFTRDSWKSSIPLENRIRRSFIITSKCCIF